MVFAFVKNDIDVIRKAEAITMTANRSVMLASALRTTMGARRRTTMMEAINDRVSCCTKESGYMDILESREMSHRGCLEDGAFSRGSTLLKRIFFAVVMEPTDLSEKSV